MLKQIFIHGRAVELHSSDGRIWCSSVRDVLEMKRRKKELEDHIRTISKHIYLRRVNDCFGTDSEDPFPVHMERMKL